MILSIEEQQAVQRILPILMAFKSGVEYVGEDEKHDIIQTYRFLQVLHTSVEEAMKAMSATLKAGAVDGKIINTETGEEYGKVITYNSNKFDQQQFALDRPEEYMRYVTVKEVSTIRIFKEN